MKQLIIKQIYITVKRNSNDPFHTPAKSRKMSDILINDYAK